MSPQPIKYDFDKPHLNLLAAFIGSIHDDLHGHGVVSGREVPKKYKGRSYQRRVMIERVVQRRAANSYLQSDGFKEWTERLNDWTGAKVTSQELEESIRVCCIECKRT